MFETIEGAPAGVIAVRAVGRITADDYREVLEPAILAAAGAGDIRLVVQLGDDFEGYAAGAAIEDMKVGIEHLRAFERIAVVTDHTALGDAVRIFASFMPGEVRVYSTAGLAEALAWAGG